MTWMQDERHLRFNDDNTLELMGGRTEDGKWEATCPICGCEILWCLEMISFTTGDFGLGNNGIPPFTMCHARCAWTPGAFQDEAVRARQQEIHNSRVRAGKLGGTAKRDNHRRNEASRGASKDSTDVEREINHEQVQGDPGVQA